MPRSEHSKEAISQSKEGLDPATVALIRIADALDANVGSNHEELAWLAASLDDISSSLTEIKIMLARRGS